MEYRNLGRSGVKVSVVGLGTNQFGSSAVPQQAVNNILDAALEQGINYIDSADVYKMGESETTLGQALKGRWDKVVLATKFYFPVGDGPNDRGTSRYHLMNSLENSLRRLQNDHVDLYYVHRWDPGTPIEETLRALDDLVRMGKVRYLGASEFAAWQLAEANLLAEFKNWTRFSVLQSHYHMLERKVEEDILPFCNSHQIGFIPYFPLAGGFLTGKYKRGQQPPAGSRGERDDYVQGYFNDRNFTIVEKLSAWCAQHGHKLNELALAWLAAQPGVVSVISGATRVDHVQGNAKAAEWQLSTSDLQEIETILQAQGE